ncbi:hypothetical protein Acr_03g0008300 [Actinidia rufa]|uniref:Transmembrane protein n=1 Tax=Actinidia rufa TaxID=165716 RepID=A0A7J0ECY6_9ERIC|nr:hypothetical protein Acr_03g0008300 [Actinidia rufa]
MAPRIKTSLLLFLLLLIYSYSGELVLNIIFSSFPNVFTSLLSRSHFPLGVAEGFSDNANPIHSLHKNGVPMNSRKLLVVDTVLDYDYTGPNPKHDPRKGKPGNGGKNP